MSVEQLIINFIYSTLLNINPTKINLFKIYTLVLYIKQVHIHVNTNFNWNNKVYLLFI